MATGTKKKLTGKHVLAMVLVFFGLLFAVNILFVYYAVSSFRGEDVKRSYMQGIDYNTTLETRAEQEKLGWRAAANLGEDLDKSPVILVKLTDNSGAPMTGLTVTGLASHRVDTAFDKELVFTAKGRGRYSASVSDLAGPYILKAIADNGEDVFRFEYSFEAQ